MATITKNQAGNWKALIRKNGWPTAIKTFRVKRDAEIGRGALKTKWCVECTSIAPPLNG